MEVVRTGQIPITVGKCDQVKYNVHILRRMQRNELDTLNITRSPPAMRSSDIDSNLQVIVYTWCLLCSPLPLY